MKKRNRKIDQKNLFRYNLIVIKLVIDLRKYIIEHSN